jgi:hypothetical protein
VFTNAGSFRVANGPSVASTLGVQFDNSGTVTVGTGAVLVVDGGGIHSGQFLVSNASQLVLSNSNALGLGSQSFMPSSRLTIDSTSSVTSSGGTNFVLGIYDCAGVTQSTGGVLYLAAPANVTSIGKGLVVSGGFVGIYTADLNTSFPPVTISGSGVLDASVYNISMASLTVSGGALSKLGIVRVLGPLQWTAGTLQGPGTLVSTTDLVISTAGAKVLQDGILFNDHVATWLGGDVTGLPGGVFVNTGTLPSLIYTWYGC